MPEFEINRDAPILVEFAVGPGVQQVAAIRGIDVLTDKSNEAVQSAMDTIHNMADKVAATVKKMTASPSEVEVTFGLKFDAKAGVLVASTGLQASVQVKLKWKRE
jgi:hypothetical protein